MRMSVLAVLLAALPGLSQAAQYTIDKEHSSVSFKIRHFASRVQGSFTNFGGMFSFDEKNPENSSVDAVIRANSINTRNAMRDKHLRAPDFFDAEKHPTITFKSSKVTPGAEKGRYKVDGVLSMHGVDKPLTLDVEYAGEANDMKGNAHAGFSATGMLNRKDFGIVYNKVLDAGGMMLGDDVSISIEVEALKAK